MLLTYLHINIPPKAAWRIRKIVDLNHIYILTSCKVFSKNSLEKQVKKNVAILSS